MSKRYEVNEFATNLYRLSGLCGWRVVDKHPIGRFPQQDTRILAVYRYKWQARVVAVILNANVRGKVVDDG